MGSRYSSKMIGVIEKTPVPEKLTPSSPAKISLKEGRAFSLPAGPLFTCPGATDACVDCYAMKNRHEFENVQTAMARNFLLIKKLEKENNKPAAKALLLDIISDSAELFRIHESGDFFSQWYLDVWTDVVKSRKDVSFWAYTRSFKLNYSKITRQPNFNLWASTDEFNTKEANKFVKRYSKSGVKHAYGPWEHDKTTPENSVICPVTNKKLAVAGACEKCMLCVVKGRIKKSIVFWEH